MVAIGLAVAGCGSKTKHDSTKQSTPTSTRASDHTDTGGAERADAASLPAGFPTDVPVINGHIEGHRELGPLGGLTRWQLTVTGIDADAGDAAQHLLLDGGFTRDSQGRDLELCNADDDRSDFDGKKTSVLYTITLCSNTAGPNPQIKYDIAVIDVGRSEVAPAPSLPPLPNLGG
ncbi:hypothetical protein BKN37_11315 [Mycobacterium talmoniae]|uniref:Uncharacterized protein n=1 Tax=Mycobacterium talmoniae TaxID=1858794 RepID=A0A1S1NN62_9MYCO|nr:hypothetical protein [Mycobacterium eburneum]OHV04192.1 hypothetical protein BKN37_11315 [Mycobacterium talmoniae]TDH56215.1 hypothetical protein E2F47_08115 [Mycobacterium eburneum]